MTWTPQSTQSFDKTSSSRGATGSTRRIAVVGQKASGATQAVNTPVQVLDESEADTKFGKGSDVALNIRAVMKAARDYVNQYGGESALVRMPEIYGVSVADPGTPTAATYTLTVVVTTAEAGTIKLEIAGRTLLIDVAAADPQNTIAARIAAVVNAYPELLPVSAGAATNVCTLTARCTGVIGNDIRVPKVRSQPNGVTVTPAAGATGVGAMDISTGLAVLTDKRYHSVVVGTHVSGDITKLLTWMAERNAASAKQFTSAHMGEYGSVSTGTTLASAANNERFHLHIAEAIPILPGEVAGMCAGVREAEGRLHLSFNGVRIPAPPPDAADVFTPAEIETAGGNGLNPLKPTADGTGMQIVRYTTTKTSENSVAFARCIDTSIQRRMDEIALQIDELWQLKFARANRDDDTIAAVKSETYSVLLDRQKDGWVQNVEAHKAELTVTKSGDSGLDVVIPQSLVPHLHFLAGRNVLHLE